MESLIGYASEDEACEYNEEMKDGAERSGSGLANDDNYDNVQMDMSEDSNMVHSSDSSLSDASSSDGENQRASSLKYLDEDRKKERKPTVTGDDKNKGGMSAESKNLKTVSIDREDQVKAKSDNSRERPLEKKSRTEDWKERPDERKGQETYREKLEESEKKADERKRKADDSKKQDDKRETKARRDSTGRSRDEKSNSSKDKGDRDVKDRHKEPHKDNRERGIDDKRPKSREKLGKDRRRSDDLKDERRGGSRKEEKRVADRRNEDRQDNKHGEERKSKERRKDSKPDRSRSPRHPLLEDKVKRNRSRSPSSHQSTKSHSPLVLEKKSISEKRGASPRRGDHKRFKHSPDHRRRSRSRDKDSPELRRPSRSRERSMGRPRMYEKKPSKLLILERLGISLPTMSEMTGAVTPQELVQRSMQAQVQQVKSKTGIELPSYYNPAAMNPARYAEQIQKRRLLWGNKAAEPQEKPAEALPGPATGNNWEGTTFAADQDGKMTAKFKRLMGIKNQGGASGSSDAPSDGSKPEIIKKQEELFSSMEMQYEVARVATHTHRGLGLGFGTFQYPR